MRTSPLAAALPGALRSSRGLGLGLSLGLGLALATSAGCGSEGGGNERPRTFGGDRPVMLQTPAEVDDDRAYPLVLVLHGYGATGLLQQAYFGLGNFAARHDAFLLAPDGLIDSGNRQFWNADDVCCDFDGTDPDDVGYLGGLIDDVAASWPIDPGAVFAIGHSNGGFMSYRLACERSDALSGIVVLAGVAASVPCAPEQPVSVLHVHGTADDTVPFAGAQPSVEQWAGLDGCGAAFLPGADLDLDTGAPGAETRTSAAQGCAAGTGVELWAIEGGSHVPPLGGSFATTAWQWLLDHRRP